MDEQEKLLRRILEELTWQRQDTSLEEHRYWLIYEFDRCKAIIKAIEYHRRRIKAMAGDVKIESRTLRVPSIHTMSRLYRTNETKYHEYMKELGGRILILTNIKEIEDISRLKGVGPKTMEKILSKSEPQQSKRRERCTFSELIRPKQSTSDTDSESSSGDSPCT